MTTKPEDMDHETLMEYVAWTDETKLILLRQFLVERELVSDAEDYLTKIALEECGACEVDS